MHVTMHYTEKWLNCVVGMLNGSGGLVQVILPVTDATRASAMLQEIKDALWFDIKPNPQRYVSCTMSPSEIPASIWVEVNAGSARPYFIAKLGVKHGSFLLRNGEALPLSQEHLLRMLKANDGRAFEDWRADRQDITLNAIKDSFHRKGLPFGRPQLLTLGLVGSHGLYTNLAYMVSDQCRCRMDFIWISGCQGIGKILDQQAVEAILPEFSDAFIHAMQGYNTRRAECRPTVPDQPEDFPAQAMTELAHITMMLMDFSRPPQLRCCLYDNRLELWALGGPPDHIGSINLYAGEPAYRNQKLARLIERLNPGTVSRLCFSQYEAVFHRLPQLFRMEYDEMGFRITLPNFSLTRPSKPPTDYVQRSVRMLELLKNKTSLTKAEAGQQLGLSMSQTTPLLKRMLAEGLLDLNGDRYSASEAVYYPAESTFSAPAWLPCIPMP